MTILPDTSVWADHFNDYPSPEALFLEDCLQSNTVIVTCGLIITEFFQGLRSQRSVETTRPYFDDMHLLRPHEPMTYFEAATLYRGLRRRGITVRSVIDCIIVQLAQEYDVLLLAKDRDIRQILDSGLTRARAPRLAQ